jgi:hypothetical protein
MLKAVLVTAAVLAALAIAIVAGGAVNATSGPPLALETPAAGAGSSPLAGLQ